MIRNVMFTDGEDLMRVQVTMTTVPAGYTTAQTSLAATWVCGKWRQITSSSDQPFAFVDAAASCQTAALPAASFTFKLSR